MKILYISFLLCIIATCANSHTLRRGSCPIAAPYQNFDMKRFLGPWYAVKKTSTTSECIIYNITESHEPNKYKIQQLSMNYLFGLVSLKHKYSYTGDLEPKDEKVQADMNVQFPLNIAGKSDFTIFNTDYDNYGAIFTCQELPIVSRHSATILSRTKDLDENIMADILKQLRSFDIDPDFSKVQQENCPGIKDESTFGLTVDSKKISADNVPELIRKAGEKFTGVTKIINGVAVVLGSRIGEDDDLNILLDEKNNDWLP